MLDFEIVCDGCIQGDRTHQKLIYEKFYSSVYRICIKYSKSKQQTEDLTQDIFIKLFANIKKFKGSTYNEFSGWANKLSNNHCIDVFRKKKIVTISGSGSYNDGLNIENISENYDEHFNENLYDLDDIIVAVQGLSPRYKMVFNMYVMDGLTHHEISDKLDISVGSSKSNLFKAKIKLREILRNIKK